MPKTLVALAVTVVLAGCGSSDPAQAQAMKRCAKTGATHTECVCFLKQANDHGVSAAVYNREISDGTAITDKRIADAANFCLTG